jgi:hypothetical protein
MMVLKPQILYENWVDLLDFGTEYGREALTMTTNIVTTWINTKIRHEQSIQEVSHQIIESMPTSILYPSLTTGSAILGGIKSSQGIPLWASLPSRNKYLMALRILSGLTIGIVARAELPNV